jgi:deoxyribose-phosphate aldolase
MKAAALARPDAANASVRLPVSLKIKTIEVPTVDQVMIEERAASFTKRSIKTAAKLSGLRMAVSMMDLTTLEGKDTPGKVAYLCRKALQPADAKYGVPP